MSRAKQLIEFMSASTAPAIAPAKPGVKPGAPGRPAAPAKPSTNPFRRRDIRPNEAPRPKAMDLVAEPTRESLSEARTRLNCDKVGKVGFAGKAKKMIASQSGKSQSGLSATKSFKK